MNITEYAINKKLFGGGGGKREGTAIPQGERVYRIYFNTGLPREETNEILSKLTYVQTPYFDYPANIIYALVDEALNGHIIMAAKTPLSDGEIGHYIMYLNSPFNENVRYGIVNLFSPRSDIVEADVNNGWDYSLCGGDFNWGVMQTGSIGLLGYSECYPVTDFNGLPIGAENEKIKNVLSITPF